MRRLILTASGGAFRGRRREELADVTLEDALKHPTWDMGPVVTINSATMVNKGLEVIEAHELFGVAYDDIEVMVHPQSVLHSMVEFADGSTLAQASPPDMRLPIALALAWPDRVPAAAAAVDWREAHNWELRPLDERGVPGGPAGQAGGPGRGTAARRSTTRRTRSVWPPSSPVGYLFWASSTPWSGCSGRRPPLPNRVPSRRCLPRRHGRVPRHSG